MVAAKTKTTQSLIQVAKRNQVAFPLVCSCVVELASVRSQHGSNQVRRVSQQSLKGGKTNRKMRETREYSRTEEGIKLFLGVYLNTTQERRRSL